MFHMSYVYNLSQAIEKGWMAMHELVVEAQRFQEDLVAWRRRLHQNPEVGMELPNTAAFVKGKLEEMGYIPKEMAGGAGVLAMAGGKKPGKCFLLRADMDALPVSEEADLPFRSTNGNMHACGHDFHTTMLLGAARLLKDHEEEIHGSVKLMFQPGEETLQGAKAMVEEGILENPPVDAAAMFHVATGMPGPCGIIIIPGKGVFSAASDWFEIHIHGKGGHGAMPDTTIDPLNVMSHIHLGLQAIHSRELSPSDTAVVTVGMMQGGEASNVIPDTALMKGTIRTYDEKVRKFIFGRIRDIASKTADTFRATANPVIIEGCPSVRVDEDVSVTAREALAGVFGEKAVIDPALLGMARMTGSEDFAFVTQKVPSVMMMLSAGNAEEGYTYPMHHPKAKFNETVLAQGAAAYAIVALSWLNRHP